MVVVSEIFPFRMRAVAMSLAIFLNRLVSGAVATSFLSLTEALSAEASDSLERHLEEQQEAALGMPHCARAWMESAAEERQLTNQPPRPQRLHSLQRLHSSVTSRPRAGSFREASQALCRLRCVLLNGCHTQGIGRRILEAVPHVAVVCWATVTEDTAARTFAVGFFGYGARLHLELRGAERSPDLRAIQAAFHAGCASFLDAGHRFGDPKRWMHPAGHPHLSRPDYRACPSCLPPVHGSVLMLHKSEDGTVVETWGRKSSAHCPGR